jgi:excisionase family DNA binding protein
MGQGMAQPGGGGAGAMASEMAVGLAIAQQLMQQQGAGIGIAPAGGAPKAVGAGLPELLTPEQAAQALGVTLADVLAVIEAGELPAKKIGSTVRIKRAALDAYLND